VSTVPCCSRFSGRLGSERAFALWRRVWVPAGAVCLGEGGRKNVKQGFGTESLERGCLSSWGSFEEVYSYLSWPCLRGNTFLHFLKICDRSCGGSCLGCGSRSKWKPCLSITIISNKILNLFRYSIVYGTNRRNCHSLLSLQWRNSAKTIVSDDSTFTENSISINTPPLKQLIPGKAHFDPRWHAPPNQPDRGSA
jgi:hypothetical protein